MDALYFDLEPRRRRDGQLLLDAVRSRATQDFEFSSWRRIVDFQFSDSPLSAAGSIKSVGGRFNFGEDISRGTIIPFPALYIAEDAETAYKEKFGSDVDQLQGELSGLDLALRSESSFSQVRLHGKLDVIIDVGDLNALQPFVEIIRKYEMPKSVLLASRRLGLRRPPTLVRSPGLLQRQLLHQDWRAWPMQFAVPANSQVFARIASAAGIHGILYPSAKNSKKRCLALFPKNWSGSGSFVELSDPAPSTVTTTRLDGGPIVPQ